MIYAVLALGIIGLVAMFYRRDWMLPILVFSLPFDRLPSFDLLDITIRPSTILFFGALVILIGEIIAGKRKIVFSKYWLWLAVYLLVAIYSLTLALDVNRGLQVIFFTGYVFVVFFVVSQLISKENWQKVVMAVFLSGLAVCLFGLYQYLGDIIGLSTHFTGLREAYTKAIFGFPRVQSAMLEPLYLANFILLPLGLIIVAKLKDWPILKRWQSVLMIVYGLVFLLTLSRGAFIAALFLLVMMGIIFWQSFSGKKLGALIANLAIIFILAYLMISVPYWVTKKNGTAGGQNKPSAVKSFISHTTDRSDGSSLDRLSTYEIAYRVWKSSPVFGIGIGNFGSYVNRQNKAVSPRQTVNNEVLELAVETGLVGLAAILIFMGTLVISVIGHVRRNQANFTGALAGALLCVLVAIMVQYQFFSTLYITHIWVLLGLLAGLLVKEAENAKLAK